MLVRLCLRRRCTPHYSTRLIHSEREVRKDPRWPGYEVVIGIETHAQLKSRQKLFSHALTSGPKDTPNTNVSVFDAAFPGTLPKLNPKCVDLGLRASLALKCEIQKRSSFDRKHYFYSDLPSGFQITQQYAPLATNGSLEVHLPDQPKSVRVRIKQLQLEQDTAKSTFHPRTLTSQIDLNRAGTGLMEIVSEPDLRSPEEAGAYVRTLQAILRAVGASDGNMEEGSLRCDVNVSVNRIGEPFGTRCEIKNLNSVKFMMAAITSEIRRHIDILNSPTPVVAQETRGFDENTFETFKLRSKEDAPDYRYMPDPNLGTLLLSEERIQVIESTMPELPWQIRQRLITSYGLSERNVDTLLKLDSAKDVPLDGDTTAAQGPIQYFDTLCEGKRRDPKVVFNWMAHELLGQLTARKQTFQNNTLSTQQLAELIDLVQEKQLTGTSAKYLLRHILSNPNTKSTREVAEEQQLLSFPPTSPPPTSSTAGVTPEAENEGALDDVVLRAMAAMPKEVEALRAGRMGVMNKIVGWVMRESRGRADAKSVKEQIERLLERR
ncbi:hypothetical protein D9611_002729 [Ephemerocybe angulata]|uniref:Glutamyl-tRNA(Gln) amidotransferase subunit B, mitochondrial n=1 Tax=Ephemerocybe angulata TaxID=980116 RepID=A0A8H5C2B7_9AGAR|nr:hypothetical protein D9611_002729 [Tulosesus angulatus]